MEEKEKFHYKQFCQRLDDETIEWLKLEKEKFKSWNLFFKAIKQKYEKK